MASLDIGFELTNLCNLHCTHCIRGSHQAQIESLDLALVARVLDEARVLFDPVEVVFTGGEPLASELFPAVVAELGRRGLGYRFVTNGWLIPRHLPALLRHRPRYVRVSLSGASARTHDAQRGPGSFRRALLGAAVLLSRGIDTQMSMVVTRDSRSELAAVSDLGARLGVSELHYILPQPTPETALAGSDLSPHEWNEVTRDVTCLALASSVTIKLDYGTYRPFPRPACNTMALRQLYVDALGRAGFCCQLSRYGTGDEPLLGDLRVEPLSTVVERARGIYEEFAAETARLHDAGARDTMDDFPCLSCARRHGRTGFLAGFPQHPWVALARRPAAGAPA